MHGLAHLLHKRVQIVSQQQQDSLILFYDVTKEQQHVNWCWRLFLAIINVSVSPIHIHWES